MRSTPLSRAAASPLVPVPSMGTAEGNRRAVIPGPAMHSSTLFAGSATAVGLSFSRFARDRPPLVANALLSQLVYDAANDDSDTAVGGPTAAEAADTEGK